MPFIKTEIDDLYIFEPKIFEDSRGYFFESYNQNLLEKELNTKYNFVQDNQSKSSFGTLRGLHFQKGEHSQAKLVRVLSGKVLDIAVDLRPSSNTYKRHVSIELSAENKRQFLIPRGFAHGFIVLSEFAEFFYKCDNYYNQSAEGGINYLDPDLHINWIVPLDQIKLSDKDLKLPFMKDL